MSGKQGQKRLTLVGKEAHVEDEWALLSRSSSLGIERAFHTLRFSDAHERENQLHSETHAILKSRRQIYGVAPKEPELQNVSEMLQSVLYWYWAEHSVPQRLASVGQIEELTGQIQRLTAKLRSTSSQGQTLGFLASCTDMITEIAEAAFGVKPVGVTIVPSESEDFEAIVTLDFSDETLKASGERRADGKIAFFEHLLERLPQRELDSVDFSFRFG